MQHSAERTLRPDALSSGPVQDLKAVGPTDIEVLDLVHSVALFAWAHRLVRHLSEPIFLHRHCVDGPSMRLAVTGSIGACISFDTAQQRPFRLDSSRGC